ncbi:hypothetical protein BP5796_01322 [Coleophoma crateriformis]|uniref:BTB domain-containing protein n=1 Tax=Coleophoma crateriformis TaxID=565419 RepID=A0A3D8T1P7_9HELO|nr:hypothetical protein BP5796_01322 [Coleophoma crateriformis]
MTSSPQPSVALSDSLSSQKRKHEDSPSAANSSDAKRVKCSKLPFSKSIGHEMVDLYVGTDQELFRIHKQVLCRRIPYFSSMFSSSFREAEEATAQFPEDRAESFDILLEWVYLGRLRKLVSIDEDGKRNYDPYALYILLDKLRLPNLMDHLADMIIEHHRTTNKSISPRTIVNIYQNTSPGCPLRKYCLQRLQNSIAHPHPGGGYNPRWKVILRDNEDLLDDYLKLQHLHANKPFSRLATGTSPCEYHSHGVEEMCTVGQAPGDHEDVSI